MDAKSMSINHNKITPLELTLIDDQIDNNCRKKISPRFFYIFVGIKMPYFCFKKSKNTSYYCVQLTATYC